MSKGKLIVIEAGDSSGKETQTKKLFKRLISEQIKVKKIEFPNYKSDSSALVKMYLNGEFGENASDINPYTASTFYAVDRAASYLKEWKSDYMEDMVILTDRYTTSNAVHQASKIKDLQAKQEYLDWLYDLEYIKMGLPIPDCVIFLDMPPKYGIELMKKRNNKITGNDKKDIHEKNHKFLYDSYDNACAIADKYEWKRIDCVRDEKLRSIEDIHEDIYDIVINLIKGDYLLSKKI